MNHTRFTLGIVKIRPLSIRPHDLVCDAGEKYLDTIYNDDWLRERQLLDDAAHQRLHRLLDAYRESIRLASKGLAKGLAAVGA